MSRLYFRKEYLSYAEKPTIEMDYARLEVGAGRRRNDQRAQRSLATRRVDWLLRKRHTSLYLSGLREMGVECPTRFCAHRTHSSGLVCDQPDCHVCTSTCGRDICAYYDDRIGIPNGWNEARGAESSCTFNSSSRRAFWLFSWPSSEAVTSGA